MLWTAEQAEAWMREHPGRWLEDCDGDMWMFDGVDAFVLQESLINCGTQRWEADINHHPHKPTDVAPDEDGRMLTFHPPREHWAAEREALRGELERLCCAYLSASDPQQGRFYELAMALFRAAPKVDGE